MDSYHRIPAEDVEAVVARARPMFHHLRRARLFVTGGTGFVGRWLLETFAEASDRLDLAAEAWVLTRRPETFRARAPRLAAHPSIHVVTGDVRDVAFPRRSFTHEIHGAATADAGFERAAPAEMFDTIVEGTRRTLDFIRSSGAQRALLLSSGAVYRGDTDASGMIREESPCTSAGSGSGAYADGKRRAEAIAREHASDGVPITIARLFAFIGPLLPMDRQFAAGNFLRDALAGDPIRVASDGKSVRSYLYAADLATWLWTILDRGVPGRAYNVGSDEAVTIRDLAALIADAVDPPCSVEVRRAADRSRFRRYVPSIYRAQTELGLVRRVALREAVHKTVAWAQSSRMAC